MSIRKRRSDRSGRAPLPSPGRPPVAGRDERSRFWLAIAGGNEQRGCCGRGRCVATCRNQMVPKGRRHATSDVQILGQAAFPGDTCRWLEREEIALLRVQGRSMQEIGRRLGRSASTISRELRRNAATRSGGLEYRATTAQWHAERSARRPKPTKLALNATLRTYVEERLAGVVVAPSGVPVPGPAVPGRAAGMASDRIGDGPGPGARSRLPGACRSTSRTTRRCASATKPSIRPSSSKAEERCAANSRPACEQGACCGCRGRAYAGAARVLSRRRS